jgi:hypothetical protein
MGSFSRDQIEKVHARTTRDAHGSVTVAVALPLAPQNESEYVSDTE